MRELYYITKRNSLIFLRDRSAVFFSMLSMFIVLALMVIFLGDMNSEGILSTMEEYSSTGNVTAEDKEHVSALIGMWTLAGVLAVNAVTVTLTVLGSMVRDETEKRIMAFYVTPVKRRKLAFGYILSAWMIGSLMCLLTLAAGEVYFMIKGYGLLSAAALLKLTGMILCNTFTFSAVGYLMALFVHSDGAWSGMLTIVGTLSGFVGGIYLPVSQLTKTVQTVIKRLPNLHGASMMRKVCTADLLKETFAGLPDEFVSGVSEEMGITVSMHNSLVDTGWQILILLAYAALAIVCAVIITNRRKLNDR